MNCALGSHFCLAELENTKKKTHVTTTYRQFWTKRQLFIALAAISVDFQEFFKTFKLIHHSALIIYLKKNVQQNIIRT